MRDRQPDYKISDMKSYNTSFETCVLNGHRECQFIEDTDLRIYGGHRSQVAQFCGHDEVSPSFTIQFLSLIVLDILRFVSE